MILVIDAYGNLISRTPEDIYQGSNEANKIQIIAPLSVNSLIYGKFKTPVITSAEYEFTRSISVNSEQNIWELDLPLPITQYNGIIEMQIKAVLSNQVIMTSNINIKVKKGIPVTLPEEPTPDVYEQILSNIASLSGDLENKQDAYDEDLQTTSKYVVGAINELKARIDALYGGGSSDDSGGDNDDSGGGVRPF